jgi:hypothetical protein
VFEAIRKELSESDFAGDNSSLPLRIGGRERWGASDQFANLYRESLGFARSIYAAG